MPQQDTRDERDRLEEDKRNAQIREETNIRNSLATDAPEEEGGRPEEVSGEPAQERSERGESDRPSEE